MEDPSSSAGWQNLLSLFFILLSFFYLMQILWIPLINTRYKDFFDEITSFEKKSVIFTPNPEIILKTLEDLEFKEILIKADYLVPDWTGLFIAYQIINLRETIKNNFLFYLFSWALIPLFIFNVIFRKKYIYWKYGDKICWSDLTLDLLKFAEINKVKITILDLFNPSDDKKVASQKVFSEKLKEKYNTLEFDYFIYDESKKDEIINKIKNSDSKILFSTLGMKKQEVSILEVIKTCENIKIWAWIWSSFDYIIWFQTRAPKIWRILWCEWMYRLFTWPQKMKRLKRLYNAIFVFIYFVIKSI